MVKWGEIPSVYHKMLQSDLLKKINLHPWSCHGVTFVATNLWAWRRAESLLIRNERQQDKKW